MSVYQSLALYLDGRREVILKRWLEAALRSSEVKTSEEVSITQLRDHVPSMLENLSERFRQRSESNDREVAFDASEHGYFRWQQGYDLSEVLTELSLLRSALIDELHAFPFPPGTDPGPTRLLHNFMDDVVRFSTIRFAEEQQATLKKVSDSRMGLLRTVSHEVRNAVNAIHLIHVLQREEEDVEEQERCRESLDRTVDQLRELLDDLLHFSQLAGGEVEAEWTKVDPVKMAKELVEPYRSYCLKHGLALEVEVDPTLEAFESDPKKLRQIGSNLLGNAVKYTSAGRITLRLLSVDAFHWTLQVSDTGMGISQQSQIRLFEEFYRAPGTEKINGTGLGLAISKRLVELLGGTIRVESKEYEGSTFEAILPKKR